ncbi:MAG: hypothetical protein K5799_07550 [Erythrobacter sp.]|nr:hypothetical protein [Erythrobacter sp.]
MRYAGTRVLSVTILLVVGVPSIALAQRAERSAEESSASTLPLDTDFLSSDELLQPTFPANENSDGLPADRISTREAGLDSVARTVDAGSGLVGQRQTTTGEAFFGTPLGRISSRIGNRIENRLRTRVDADYDPMANATDPFNRAAEELGQKPDNRSR